HLGIGLARRPGRGGGHQDREAEGPGCECLHRSAPAFLAGSVSRPSHLCQRRLAPDSAPRTTGLRLHGALTRLATLVSPKPGCALHGSTRASALLVLPGVGGSAPTPLHAHTPQ